MIENFPSPWLTDEHRMLQDSAARFFRERWVPQAAKWREAGPDAAGNLARGRCAGAAVQLHAR